MNKLIQERKKLFREKFPVMTVSIGGVIIHTEEHINANLKEVEAFNAETTRLIVEQIEDFAHKEMKDGNLAYEKLLVLLEHIKE